jgi:serine/threonine-protein phosphatase 2A activator
MAAPSDSEFPPLRLVKISELSSFQEPPAAKIRSDEDVELWKTTQGYHDYGLFLRRLNEAVVGCQLPWISPSPSHVST